MGGLSLQTETHLSCTVNTITADDLVVQRAKISTAILLAKLSSKSFVLTPEDLKISEISSDILERNSTGLWHVVSRCHRITSHDVIMTTMASQIISLAIVYSIVYSDGDQRKHQSSASLGFVRGIQRSPVNSPHKWPVTRKMFPFDYVIMTW